MLATTRSLVGPLFAGALLLLAGCGGGTQTVDAGSPPAPAPDPTAPAVDLSQPVLVGLLAPISASDEGAARLGRAMANAARMALSDSATGGLRLEVYDTSGTGAGAATAARNAIADGAAILVGPLFSQSTRAVAPVAAQAGINVISFSTDATVAGDPIYLSGYLPEAEARRITAFAARRGLNSIAVFYPQTAYGEAARRGMQQAAQRTGVRIVAEAGYPRSFQGIQETAGAFAQAARRNGANAVLLADGGQGLRSVGAFLAYRELSSGDLQYMGLGQWNTPITLEEPALKGGVFPAPDPDRVRAFLARYAQQFGEQPPVLAVLGYDGLALAAQMLKDARAGQSAAFGDRQLTRPEGWQGVFGPLRFFSDGTSERGMAVLRVEETGFDVLEPSPRSYGAGL